MWWAIEDLNLGPLACEASALTTELIAQIGSAFNCKVRVCRCGIPAVNRVVATTGFEPVT